MAAPQYELAEAKKCFEQNLTMLGNPQSDPLAWNLYSGLLHLVEALEGDWRQRTSAFPGSHLGPIPR
jgi:hypothetical protein